MFPIWLWPTSLSGWASADWAGRFGPEGNNGFSLFSINLIDFHLVSNSQNAFEFYLNLDFGQTSSKT
jgi:hypothetical protein